jgi:cytochrome b561
MSARHLTSTKLVHGALAILVAVQLVSSLIMQVPQETHPENVFYEVHRVGGFAAGGVALIFWGLVLFRTVGTDAGLLMPWFSPARRAAFVRDALRHLRAMRRGHFAQYRAASPFPAALQGLGLLLVSAMAATGLTFTFVQDDSLLGAALWAHGLMADLVWAFLIGHGLTALLHHYAGEQDLADMWSLGDPHFHHEGTRHDS